jgi:predicted dehydrogenase
VIRVGIVGTGFGARVVAPAFEAAGCTVVDVVSARDGREVGDLCRRDLDLVCVHSPPFLHEAHVRLAIDAGRSVLCDKPFGRSSAEAAAMLAHAEEAGVVHLLNFEFRHEPGRLRVNQLIQDHELGEVEHVQWSALTSGSRAPLRRFGWLFQASLGGGWINAWGSHAVDALRWLVGDLAVASATRYLRIPDRPDADGRMCRCDAEDGFTGTFSFATGATASVDASFASSVTGPARFTLVGSDGVLDVTNDRRLILRRPDGTRTEEEMPRASGDVHDVAMRRWAEAVRDAVGDATQISPSFLDGLRCAQVMDGLRATPLLVAGPGGPDNPQN